MSIGIEHMPAYRVNDEGDVVVPDDTAHDGLTDSELRDAAERMMLFESDEYQPEDSEASQDMSRWTALVEWAEDLITQVEDKAERDYSRVSSSSDAESLALTALGISGEDYDKALQIRYQEKERASKEAAQAALAEVRRVVDSISEAENSHSDHQRHLAQRRARLQKT